MKNASSILNLRSTAVLALLTSVLMLGLAPKAHAQPSCSNAHIRGGYGYHALVTIVPAGTTRTVIGVYTFDGRGGYTANLTVNDYGSIFSSVTDAGTYVVNADCTATLSSTSGGSIAAVVVDGGKELYMMRTDPASVVQYSTAKKLSAGG